MPTKAIEFAALKQTGVLLADFDPQATYEQDDDDNVITTFSDGSVLCEKVGE